MHSFRKSPATFAGILLVAGLLTLTPLRTQGQGGDQQPRQLPPPTDVDPKLTEELRRLELELGEAALHGFKDSKTVERLVGPEFTVRVSDAPERSIPRSLWGQPASAYKIESLEEKLCDVLAFALPSPYLLLSSALVPRQFGI